MSIYQQKKMLGMMLIEALVAIAIFMIVITAVTILFSSLWRMQQSSVRLGNASQKASHIVMNISENIRNARQADNGAYPIKSITSNEIIFFADIDHDSNTERVRIFRNGNILQMGIIDPSQDIPVEYNSNTETISTIATFIVDNLNGDPLFTYYNDSNMLLTLPIPASDIRMVGITVTVDMDPNRDPAPTTVTTFSSIRNLRQQ